MKVDILETMENEKQKVRVTFGWDEKEKKVVILKDYKRMGEAILSGEYWGRETGDPSKKISAKDGKKFLQELCYGLSGSIIRATRPYKW